jgi:hypothetical protein
LLLVLPAGLPLLLELSLLCWGLAPSALPLLLWLCERWGVLATPLPLLLLLALRCERAPKEPLLLVLSLC